MIEITSCRIHGVSGCTGNLGIVTELAVIRQYRIGVIKSVVNGKNTT